MSSFDVRNQSLCAVIQCRVSSFSASRHTMCTVIPCVPSFCVCPWFGECRHLVCAVNWCVPSFGVWRHLVYVVIQWLTAWPHPNQKKKKKKKEKKKKKKTNKKEAVFEGYVLPYHINSSFCSRSTSIPFSQNAEHQRFVLFALHKQTFRSVRTPQANVSFCSHSTSIPFWFKQANKQKF